MNDYLQSRKTRFIKPIAIPNKEKYYLDLSNIENSFSGLIEDGRIINTFILEAVQLLINAIELFENGYFDCAFYSLRSAIDVSTTMVYFTDMPEEDKKKKFENWKNQDIFPFQSKMIKALSENGITFSDMRTKMKSFFEDAKNLSEKINKYVHKQGFQNFYVVRNHQINEGKSQDKFIAIFENYLKKCIGVVAVMRLASDPFPILLMDDEILYRCFDVVTDPYSEDFVDKYIGDKTVQAYKDTLIYQDYYNYFITLEKKNQATFDVMKYECIDTEKIEDIFQQSHLLSVKDMICVTMINSCEKLISVFTSEGWGHYSTDRKSNRSDLGWDSRIFKQFAENQTKTNQPFDETFISVFSFNDENYYAEHNVLLNYDEIAQVNKSVEDYLQQSKVLSTKQNT